MTAFHTRVNPDAMILVTFTMPCIECDSPYLVRRARFRERRGNS